MNALLDLSPMTGAELRELRKRIGITQAVLAEVVGYRRPGTISEAEAGKTEVARAVAVIVRLLAEREE